jgi:iron complex outermembrane receptor protein
MSGWSRSLWSVCLVPLVSVGIATMAAGAAGQSGAGQEPEIKLDEVVVSATRLADLIQDLKRVPGQVYTVTHEDIQREKPRTVQEALQVVPGIVLYDSIGNTFQPSLDLRGFNSQPGPSIAVFMDGVRINEPDTNFINFDLIPIQDVERIEVLPGGTAIFGRNAIGGVINIVTRRGGKGPQTTVEAAGGSHHHYRASANTSGPIKDLDYYLSLVQDRESGFRDVSDGRMSRGTMRLGYRPSEATDLSLGYQYVNDRLEQAGSLTLAEEQANRRQNTTPGDYAANELSGLTLQARQRLGAGFSVSGNGFYRQLSQDAFTSFTGGTLQSRTETDRVGGTLQLSHEGKLGDRLSRFSLGGEVDHGEVDVDSVTVFFGTTTAKRKSDEMAWAVYVQEGFDLLPNLTLTAGVRYDATRYDFEDPLKPANNAIKDFDRWTPRAGLTYTPWSALTLYANYGEGFRVPTTMELFAFPTLGSNPALKPMNSRTYEAGLRARPFGWLEGTLAVFLTDVKDEIVYDGTWTNVNLPKSRRQGVEAGLRLKPHAMVDLHLTYTYTDATFRTNATLSYGDVEKGDQVPLVPAHRATGTIKIRPLAGLELSLTGQYVGRQVLLNDESNAQAYRLQDAFILGARASYTWKQITWWFQGNNLTDARYETYGAMGGFPVLPNVMPAPGINVLGGVTVKFEDYY